MKQDKLLRVSMIRDRLNCSPSHVYSLIKTGDLPAVKVGRRKGLRVFSSDVEKYLQESAVD